MHRLVARVALQSGRDARLETQTSTAGVTEMETGPCFALATRLLGRGGAVVPNAADDITWKNGRQGRNEKLQRLRDAETYCDFYRQAASLMLHAQRGRKSSFTAWYLYAKIVVT